MKNRYKMEISVSNGDEEVICKLQASAKSCFFKNTRLFLFTNNVWSNYQPEEIMAEGDTVSLYLTKEGLRKQIRLPNDIASDFREAFDCYLDNHFTASVVMSRRLLERVLISKGASTTHKERICDMLKELVANGTLDSRLKSLADNIKYLGNKGAHIKETVSKSDAEQALHFCDFLVTWLFGEIDEVPNIK